MVLGLSEAYRCAMSTSDTRLLADPPGALAKVWSCSSSNVRMHTSHDTLPKSATAATYVGGVLLQQQYLLAVKICKCFEPGQNYAVYLSVKIVRAHH